MKCERCHYELKDQQAEQDQCPQCGESILDDSTQDSIRRFKWYFIGIIVFCVVMMLYLPR